MGVTLHGLTARGLSLKGQEFLLPTDLAGCTTWYKWKTGVTVDGSNNVSSWADSGGSDNIPVGQGTSTRRPAYDASTGRILFDGADDFLRSAAIGFISSSGLEITLVLEARPSIGAQILHRSRNTAADTDGLRLSHLSTGKISKSVNVGTGSIVSAIEGSEPSAGTKYVLSFQWTKRFFVNGGEVIYSAQAGASSTNFIDLGSNANNPRWCFGALDSNSGGNPTTPSNYSNLALYEMCAHNNVFTTLERTKLVNYFQVKHGII